MFQHSTKFKILSSDVFNSDDIMDKLVHVQHVLSGQEGVLLCSHRSQWPVELVDQADWLAGCYTPASAPTEKLVLGRHPEQKIGTKIDHNDRTIVLTLSAEPYVSSVCSVLRQVWTLELSKRKASKILAIVRLLDLSEVQCLDQFLRIYGYCAASMNEDVRGLRPYIFHVLAGPAVDSQSTLTAFLFRLADEHDVEIEQYDAVVLQQVALAPPAYVVPQPARTQQIAVEAQSVASLALSIAATVAAIPVAFAGFWAVMVVGMNAYVSGDNIIHGRPVLEHTMFDHSQDQQPDEAIDLNYDER